MSKVYDGIIGFVVGDALGVPVEFKKRDTFLVEKMIGYGTYNQPPGTWSDDSSMTLATLESIGRLGKIDLPDIMENFSQWLQAGCFTPYGEVFDIGIGTCRAITRYLNGMEALKCGGRACMDNGNGSLMRILPISFVPHELKDVFNLSRLTHAHGISLTACAIYVSILNELLAGKDKEEALQNGLNNIEYAMNIPKDFDRLPVIKHLKRDEIHSSGYVVDTLEAALWCMLQGHDYKSTVLMAVNLGEDTDTVAAITGGLAGIIYGADDIPVKWLKNIPQLKWIRGLCDKVEDLFSK